MPAADERRLRQVIEPLVATAGFDLEALTVQTAGRRRVVKVVVDSDEGVDLDRAAALSRSISADLDARDAEGAVLGSAAYVLEVTSPGVGRPLTEPRHFRRSRRRLLVVTTTDGRTVTGHLLRVAEPAAAPDPAGAPPWTITLLVGAAADEVVVGGNEIARARVEVEFSSAPAAVRDRLDAELGPVAVAAPVEFDTKFDTEFDTDTDIGTGDDDETDDDETDIDESDDGDNETGTDGIEGDESAGAVGGKNEGAHR